MKYSAALDKINISTFEEELACHPERIVDRAENSYHTKIMAVCEQIIAQNRQIILLTGPSASGKTTTAQRIAQALLGRKKKVSIISLDNFYRAAAELPKWKDGYQNYESIEGLDLPYFEKKVTELLKTGHAQFPLFDFSVNLRAKQTVDLTFDQDTFLIFEGIHALNPLISEPVSHFPAIKIYISTHSEFVDEDGSLLLCARDLRLTRRILRDYTYRGTGVDETLLMWDYVLMGEDLYIRPYRQYADFHIDSTHLYEPFLYHSEIMGALRHAAPDSPYRHTIERLQSANRHFFGIDSALIPKSSLIQEFLKP